MTLLVGLCDP